MTAPESPNKTADGIAALTLSERLEPSPVASKRDRGQLALLLDLSASKRAAIEWAEACLPGAQVQRLDKADLKWGSKHDALARIRALAPDTFAVFTSDLEMQSARRAIILFAALSGARRIILGDMTGKIITRSRSTALLIDGPRFALELLAGYALLVPLSWLMTKLVSVSINLRSIARASEGKTLRQDKKKETARSALYVRATLVASSTADLAAGGMASHVAGFARGALALDHRLKFLASSSISVPGHQIDLKLIPPSSFLSATRLLFELWNNLAFTVKALRYASEANLKRDVDFIYQRYSRFNWTGAALSLATGLPLLLEFNGSEVWVSRHWDPVGQLWLLKRFELLNLRAADLIFVVSEVERRNLIAAGIDGRRIVVNPNGVDTTEFRPGCGGRKMRAVLGVENKIVIGFLGTFGPWHGAPVLAEAACLLSDASVYHFLFIGDGDQRGLAESIIDSAGRGASATFTGRVPHEKVRALLDACDILVSPHVPSADGSEFFGSPTKLFEYLAMARPVIASRLGQIASVIMNGENGLLVEPGNPSELAKQIERLAKDEAMRARLGAAARRSVSERYTWKRNAAHVFDST